MIELSARLCPTGVAPQIVVPGHGTDPATAAALVRVLPGTEAEPARLAEVMRGVSALPDHLGDQLLAAGVTLYVAPPLLPHQGASGTYGRDDGPFDGDDAVVFVGPVDTAEVALHELLHAWDDYLQASGGLVEGGFFTDTDPVWQGVWLGARAELDDYGSGSSREGFAEWGARWLLGLEEYPAAVESYFEAHFWGVPVG